MRVAGKLDWRIGDRRTLLEQKTKGQKSCDWRLVGREGEEKHGSWSLNSLAGFRTGARVGCEL